MKKRFISLFLVATMVFTLAGCSKSNTSKETKTEEVKTEVTNDNAQETSAQGLSGTFSILCDSVGAAAFDEVMKEYNKINPDVKMDKIVYADQTESETIMTSYIASDSLPDMIYVQSSTASQEYAKEGYLHELDSLGLPERLVEGNKELIEYDGKLYQFPMKTQVVGIATNLDALEQYGVSLDQYENGYPENRDEWIGLMQQLKDAGMESPLGIAGSEVSSCTSFIFDMLYQNIYQKFPTYYSEILEGSKSWAGDEMHMAFEKYDEVRPFISADAVSVDTNTLLRRFVTGEVAFIQDYTGSLTSISELDSELNFTYIPACYNDAGTELTTITGFDNCVSITSNSENYDLSADFLKFLTLPENAKVFAEKTSLIPTVVGCEPKLHPALDTLINIVSTNKYKNSKIYSRQWISGFKEILKPTCQNWLVGEDVNELLDHLQAEHQRLLDADPEFVKTFLENNPVQK